ncbi:hypothetical protein J4Q44_G00320720 [Coregonus suidteri]|uniref:Uncharacterized protein n=1 Tax=Coregonus suidteri TaxID=861788 RepID=A0AAN8KMA4_9TELE
MTGRSICSPTSWGDLLGSEMGESMLPDPTLAVDPAPSPAGVTSTPAAAEPGVSLAPPPSAAAAPPPRRDEYGSAGRCHLLRRAVALRPPLPPTDTADAAAESTGGETKPAAPAAASGAELMAGRGGPVLERSHDAHDGSPGMAGEPEEASAPQNALDDLPTSRTSCKPSNPFQEVVACV